MCASAQAQIVYSGDGPLYQINPDGSDRRLFTTPTSPEASDSEPAWSPDGSQLAVIHQRRDYDASDRTRIDLLDADGSNRRSVTRLEAGVFVSSPRWSPDGSQLVFTRATERSDRYTSAIVVRDLATGSERTLVRQRLDRRFTSVGEPEWSPNGDSVVYTVFSLDRQAYFQMSLRVVPAGGGSSTLLGRDAHSAAFSPDGSSIAFVGIGDHNGSTCGSDECFYNGELYVMDAAGGGKRRLTRSKGYDGTPAWAPDGTRIAFASNRNFPHGFFGYELYSIEPDGDCLTWLTNGTANSADPAWVPGTAATDPGGCGATARQPLLEVDLGPAFAFEKTQPLWLGRVHRGLLLSDVESEQMPLFFGYEDCGRYRPHDCPPGIQILVESVCSRDRHTEHYLDPTVARIERRRGALVADFGAEAGITVLTGGAEVHVISATISATSTRRAFRELRPFPRDENVERLEPPVIPASLAREIRRVVRVHRRLGSVRATAEQTGLRREVVRRRLANAEALREYGGRVRTTDC